MYALSFDMVISDLKLYYGEPYNNAYFEIKEILKKSGFEWIQGSTYMTRTNDLGALVKAVMLLSRVDWFKKSVRDIRGYKVEDWSNFTDIVQIFCRDIFLNLFVSDKSFHSFGVEYACRIIVVRIDEVGIYFRMSITDGNGRVKSENHESCGICVGCSTISGYYSG